MTSLVKQTNKADEIKDGRNRRRQKSADRIFEVAMNLLEDCAYDELSVEEICQKAEVGRATFFRVFGGKDGILRELNIRIAARIKQKLLEQNDGDVVSRLNVVGREIALTWTNATVGALSLAIEYTARANAADVHTLYAAMLAEVEGIIRQAIDDGEIQSSFPADFLGKLTLLHMAAAVTYWMENRELDLYEIMYEAVSSWANGHLNQPAEITGSDSDS